jgi:hypothetical protein
MRGPHATSGSWPRLQIFGPLFVWENKKIDSRPPNRSYEFRVFFRCRAQNDRLGEESTLGQVSPACDAPGVRCGRLKSPVPGGRELPTLDLP